MIARQKIQVGIGHAGRTVAVEEADTTFLVYDGAQLLTEAGGLALGCPAAVRACHGTWACRHRSRRARRNVVKSSAGREAAWTGHGQRCRAACGHQSRTNLESEARYA